jgi:acyl-homoserine-lactone acylase
MPRSSLLLCLLRHRAPSSALVASPASSASTVSFPGAWTARLCAAGLVLALGACAQTAPPSTGTPTSAAGAHAATDATVPASRRHYTADIRRTCDGTAHIRADDWGGLGYGFGYAQAEDNLCTLAESVVTFRGERALNFGINGHVAQRATFGQPTNLDADLYFRLILDDTTLARYRDAQSPRGRALAQGFAAGINRYLSDLRSGADSTRHAACRNADWLRDLPPVTETDVYRRLYAATLAAGSATQIAAIARAQPPSAHAAAGTSANAASRADTRAALASLTDAGIGSNAIAFGAKLSANGRPILYGSPHWYWQGADRLYPAHLTIPGTLDVSGVGLLGAPFVMIGFTRQVAWTHTVSTARRFGLMALTLDPAEPTRYRLDGRTEALRKVTIEIPVRDAQGRVSVVSRTRYRNADGPVVDLSAISPALGWTARQAFVLRDANAGNFGLLEHYLRMAQADSLDTLAKNARADAASPWVNTLAIGRGDARVWYGDIGPVPGVPDALAAECTAKPAGEAFAKVVPGLPVLDGSRSACAWQTTSDSPLPGTLGRALMPDVMSDTVVANMNDSAWLSAPDAPLPHLSPILGPSNVPLSLRTRAGLARITALRAGGPISPQAVRDAALHAQPYSATLTRQTLLARACEAPIAPNPSMPVQVSRDPLDGKPLAATESVDIAPACRVLAAWDGNGERASRGANLWDAVWIRLAGVDPTGRRALAGPFDAAHAATSPDTLSVERDALRQALGAAVLEMRRMGLALDSRRDEALHATRGGRRIGLAGGCDIAGYFSVICADARMGPDRYAMDVSPRGDTYQQVVTFPPEGVDATTLDASGPADDPADPRNGTALQAWADKRWQRAPFDEADVAAATVSERRISQ